MFLPLTDFFGLWPFRGGSGCNRPPVEGLRHISREPATGMKHEISLGSDNLVRETLEQKRVSNVDRWFSRRSSIMSQRYRPYRE